MNSQHTPGPWKTTTGGVNGAREVFVDGPNDWMVATCHGARGTGEANARLIAAAPDMLAALKGLLEAVWPHVEDENHEVDYCRAAREAIDKAEGRSV